MNFIGKQGWADTAQGAGEGPGPLGRQARMARALGSPFVAAVLEAGERTLHHAPRSAHLIDNWAGDAAAAAVALRFNAALHALARRGSPPELARLYRQRHGDFDGVIALALSRHDRFIAKWLGHPTQTNEVARSSALIAALMVASARFGLPFELLELGASAGLNLNLARYHHQLGGISAGTAGSPVALAPGWQGPPPPDAPVEITGADGVDLAPLDALSPATRQRLMAYVWADQDERARRLRLALNLARLYPPNVEKDDAATWLAGRLARRQPAGCCRAVIHSMVRQYLDTPTREALGAALGLAGAHADADHPLVRIGFEWTTDRSEVLLSMTSWPGGDVQVLASCQPYGEWIDWRG